MDEENNNITTGAEGAQVTQGAQAEPSQENITIPEQTNTTPKADEKPETKPDTEAKDEKPIDYTNIEYDNIKNIATTKGLDFENLQNEFIENNCVLTDGLRLKFQQAGIPADFMIKAAEGLKALHEKEMDNIAEVIGGRNNLTQTLEWARNNLDAKELAEIRADLANNPSETTAKAMVNYLHNKMLMTEGSIPKYMNNTTGNGEGGDVFKSKAEAIKAMSDPKYDSNSKEFDETFAAEIDAKLERTNKANGTPLFN